jgi:hypothetical protein
VVRQKRPTAMLRLHQFHRPSDGTWGEPGFIQLPASFLSYLNPYKMSRVCLFDWYQTNNV